MHFIDASNYWSYCEPWPNQTLESRKYKQLFYFNFIHIADFFTCVWSLVKNYLITAILALAIGFGLGSYLMPRIETQTVETEKEVIRRDVVTEIREIVRPDGSRETVSTIVDKSKEQKDSKSVITTIAQSNWHVSLNGSVKSLKLEQPIYTLQIERRVLGDIYIGGSVSSEKAVGLSIGMEF